jgi:F-type H+-transporting ATPase subunit b
MDTFLIIGAADLGTIARDTAQTFGLDWPHFIAQAISFGIVAFLLHRFAYKPILTVLEQRRERIAESLANADKIKQELAEAEKTRKEILARANTDATKLIEEARAAAAKVQEEETQKAVRAAEDIIAKAREAAQADHARMLTELRREVGRLVVDTTMKVTGKVLTSEDQTRLARETNAGLAA